MSDSEHTQQEKTSHQGRKAVISREDLISAALKLVGPHRSISSLSLREVARAADIAQFRNLAFEFQDRFFKVQFAHACSFSFNRGGAENAEAEQSFI